jgi:LmbE family N-acetylglucosaminyl deacetylase
MSTPRLLAILAHPDDETLGVGPTLAKYAAEGVEIFLLTATRGQSGRFRGIRQDDARHPGPGALAGIRESELRAAAGILGVREVTVLDYHDRELDRARPPEAIECLAGHLRRIRPDVVITFPPDGAYGHPDHIAISQFTSSAIVTAADPAFRSGNGVAAQPYATPKLYYIAWTEPMWAAYQTTFGRAMTTVDGTERHAVVWPEWSITTRIETRRFAATVWRAIACHESQVGGHANLRDLSDEERERVWESQTFYRVFSTVNGGRALETDLFDGIRR